MASVKKTITESFLTCSICFEIFKGPKSLPCLHTFCHDCLRTFIEKSPTKSYSCPVCRENFTLPTGGVSKLKTNFILKQMIEVLESSKPDVKKYCSFCVLQYGYKEEAVSRCLTCNDLLCSICAQDRHTFTRQTRHHQVVSLKEIASGKYVEEIRNFGNIPCDDHVDECIRFFCETCSLPICRECIILKHRNHEYIPASEARQKKEVEIKKLMISLSKRSKLLSQVKSEVSTKSSELVSHYLKLKKEIESKCKEAETRIKMCQNAAELTLKKQLAVQNKNLRIIVTEKTEEYDLINESLSFCQQMLKNANDIQFLFIQDEMKDRLSSFDMQDIIDKCPDVKKPEVYIQFRREFFEILVPDQITEECSQYPPPRKTKTETQHLSESMQNASNQKSMEESEETKGKEEETSKNGAEKNKANASKENKTMEIEASNENKTKEAQDERKQSNEIHNIPLPFYFPECPQYFDLESEEDKTFTKYISVSWINERVFAVVDQQNEVLKTIDIESLTLKRHSLVDIASVSSCAGGLALKLQYGDLLIFKNAFNLKADMRFSGVYGLAMSLEDAPAFVWISKEKLYIYKEGTLSERQILDERGISYHFHKPFRVCFLPNGKFVICDIAKESVYILKNDGSIFRKMFRHPGAVCSDINNNIYISDFDDSVIDVLDENGDQIHKICTKSTVSHPRAIAMSSSGKLLVVSQQKIAMFSISNLGKYVYVES